MRTSVLGLLAVATWQVASPVSARGPELARQVIAVWDGPETKVYTVMEKIGSYPKCRNLKCRREDIKVERPKIDLQRHSLIAVMYGPTNISNPDKQLRDISTACLTSGLTLAGYATIAAAPLGAVSTDLIEQGVKACLTTQNKLSQLVAPGFEVTIEREDRFEH